MVTGIILVNVERAKLAEVIEGIIKIDGVTEVYTVAGEYDIAVIVRVKTNAELSDIIACKMTHDIDGIIHTKTLISLSSLAKIDLEKTFLG